MELFEIEQMRWENREFFLDAFNAYPNLEIAERFSIAARLSKNMVEASDLIEEMAWSRGQVRHGILD